MPLVFTLKPNDTNEVELDVNGKKVLIYVKKTHNKTMSGYHWRLAIDADQDVKIMRKRNGNKVKAD
jgi:hypothetical protein